MKNKFKETRQYYRSAALDGNEEAKKFLSKHDPNYVEENDALQNLGESSEDEGL